MSPQLNGMTSKSNTNYRMALSIAALGLLACGGPKLDLGDGRPADGGPVDAGFDAGAIFIPATKVQSARSLCQALPPAVPVSGGSPAQVTARLTGVWLLCTTSGSPLGGEWLARNTRPFLFTSDGSWYALALDSAGNLIAGDAPGVNDAGIAPYGGTYSFDDANGSPVVGNGDVGFVATNGAAWFKASFTTDNFGLQMEVVDGSTQTFARVE